jgi:hypothetical protein
MPKITCEVRSVELEGDHGQPVAGVSATCTDCGHVTESFGEGDASVRRCLAVMREECPEKQRNYYVPDEDED